MANILIVDDDALSSELHAESMGAGDHICYTAESAEEAFDLLKKLSLDLILMDIGLGGMDGVSATRILKADPQTRHIPIIATTAHGMLGDRERILEAGFEEYLVKPIEPSTLLRTAESIMFDVHGKLA